MKLFIGTKEIDRPDAPRYFNLLDLDSNSWTSRELRVYQTDTHPPYLNMRNWGFACDGDHLYAPNRRHGLVKYDRDLNVVATYPGSFPDNPRYRPEQSQGAPVQFDRPHQVASIDGKIFVCDSGCNLLKVFDLSTETFRCVAFETSKNWINSVNLIEGKIHLVFHNHGWSDLVVLDRDLNLLYEKRRIGLCAHNIWQMNGERWTCSSLEGKLRSIDSGRSVDLGGYTRGVAVSGGFLLVGISQVRESQSLRHFPFDPVAGRPEIAGSGLVVLDTATLAVVGRIEFADLARDPDYRMPFLFEVRLVGQFDQAQASTGLLGLGDIERFLTRRVTFQEGE